MFQKWKIDKATIMLCTGECSPIWTHHLGVLSPDVMIQGWICLLKPHRHWLRTFDWQHRLDKPPPWYKIEFIFYSIWSKMNNWDHKLNFLEKQVLSPGSSVAFFQGSTGAARLWAGGPHLETSLEFISSFKWIEKKSNLSMLCTW